MPIYEYACRGCGHQFELLILPGITPTLACPACSGQELERLISHVAISSDSTRERSYSKAVRAADTVRDEKYRAHDEYVRKHHEEDAQEKGH